MFSREYATAKLSLLSPKAGLDVRDVAFFLYITLGHLPLHPINLCNVFSNGGFY